MFVTEQEINDVDLMKPGVSDAYKSTLPNMSAFDHGYAESQTKAFQDGYSAAIAAINNKLRVRNKETLWTQAESNILQYLMGRLRRWLKKGMITLTSRSYTDKIELAVKQVDPYQHPDNSTSEIESKFSRNLEIMIREFRREV